MQSHATHYEYDADNRLVQLTNVSAGDKLTISRTYTRDPMGNITETVEQPLCVPLAQDNYTAAYTYDPVGNRETLTTGAGTLHYLYNNAGNRLDEIRQDSAEGPLRYRFAYDADGNRIEKRDGAGALIHSIAYDQKNRVTSLLGPEAALTFAYDAKDFRIVKRGQICP